ncbi:MAG TPA: AbrB/MazE/SpoVT family DNA-binding domain-containing protein [Candidatus Acidoferrales bacterium]|nr:AbrB/MazE/SpoVT family DNA-binding domain-containing protein [Candidatus Acidoferrales bacterium]
MKKQAKITSKGQITVPHEIRKALGVGPGDSLLFEQDPAGFRIRPVRRHSPFAKYRGVGNPGIPSGRKSILRQIGRLRGH